jgi:adenylate cyclase
MGIEIERKFLLHDDSWRTAVRRSVRMAQGYLGGTNCSVRIRVGENGAYINVKSRELGVQRQEFEYAIPVSDANAMLASLSDGAAIVKTRHYVDQGDVVFEIDEFDGENRGLTVAEVELSSVDQRFAHPPWLGREVTDEPRYYNSNLVTKPFSSWSDA